MKRLFGLSAFVACLAALASAGLAGASTTVDWKATFAEQFGGPNHSPFVCPPGTSCGSGEVVGIGQADVVIAFGACGPGCSVRTLTFRDGSTIVMHEFDTNFQTPGNSGNAPGSLVSYGNPLTLDLSGTIVGGTGRFAEASGTYSGQVKVAGGTAIIQLSGTLTY